MSIRLKAKMGRARVLYSIGESVEEIAVELGVSEADVIGWKAGDKAEGHDWDSWRSQFACRDPHSLLQAIYYRLHAVVTDEGKSASACAHEVATFARLARDVARLCAGDPLQELARFRAWALKKAEPGLMGSVDELLDGYAVQVWGRAKLHAERRPPPRRRRRRSTSFRNSFRNSGARLRNGGRR